MTRTAVLIVYAAHVVLLGLALQVDAGFALPGLFSSALFFLLWRRALAGPAEDGPAE